MSSHARRLKILTWNIRDMLGDPFAVHRVIRDAGADVVCLQEASRWPGSRNRLAGVARACRLDFIVGGRASAGTALLASTRTRAEDAVAHSLPVRGRLTRPRGFARASFSLPGTRPVQITSIHLGLEPEERAVHVRAILSGLSPTDADPVVLAGDLNEQPAGPSWAALAARAVDPDPHGPATFRSNAPRRRIDAILVDQRVPVAQYGFPPGVTQTDVVRGSDHCPVLAVLELPVATGPAIG